MSEAVAGRWETIVMLLLGFAKVEQEREQQDLTP